MIYVSDFNAACWWVGERGMSGWYSLYREKRRSLKASLHSTICTGKRGDDSDLPSFQPLVPFNATFLHGREVMGYVPKANWNAVKHGQRGRGFKTSKFGMMSLSSCSGGRVLCLVSWRWAASLPHVVTVWSREMALKERCLVGKYSLNMEELLHTAWSQSSVRDGTSCVTTKARNPWSKPPTNNDPLPIFTPKPWFHRIIKVGEDL